MDFSFVDQKIQQISLALIRITVRIKRQELRSRLETLVFQILEITARRQFEQTSDNIAVLEALIKFGETIYQIEPINAKIILDELEILNSAIRQIAGFGSGKEEIADIFPKLPISINKSINKGNTNIQIHSENFNNFNPNSEKNDEKINGNGITSTIRQSAILDKIRQSGKIALKDLLGAFPEVSERTLRYDLQKLCNQEILERIGNGGPATYYVQKM